MVTCEFAYYDEHGNVVPCLATPVVDIRFQWTSGALDGGSMCEGHVLIACEQLAVDPDVIGQSIQVRRRED